MKSDREARILAKKKARLSQKQGLEPLSDEAVSKSKFIRALGSTDYLTRERGVQSLTKWLQQNSPTEQEMLKLWKGLYVCFWHSDKPFVQVWEALGESWVF